MRLRNNRLLIVVSTFTIAEVVKVDSVPPLTVEQDKLISDWFDNDYIVIILLTIPIARLSREITRKHNIKPKDAVHIATAAFWKVPLFHTYDNNLCKKSGQIGNPLLTIENPTYVSQGSLFVKQGIPVQEPKLSEALRVEPVEPSESSDIPEPPIQNEGRKIMFADADDKPDGEQPDKVDENQNSTVE